MQTALMLRHANPTFICRSLIALSLILSLLLFKPAPMYILDEIDAALDLSHTQNIGKMLRTHFSHSQFIVVSLKVWMDSSCARTCRLYINARSNSHGAYRVQTAVRARCVKGARLMGQSSHAQTLTYATY